MAPHSRSTYRSSPRRWHMDNGTMPINRRILVIDDNQEIHDDFRKVLAGGLDGAAALAAAELAILGESIGTSMGPGFEIDSAFQGQEGVARVADALREGRP